MITHPVAQILGQTAPNRDSTAPSQSFRVHFSGHPVVQQSIFNRLQPVAAQILGQTPPNRDSTVPFQPFRVHFSGHFLVLQWVFNRLQSVAAPTPPIDTHSAKRI